MISISYQYTENEVWINIELSTISSKLLAMLGISVMLVTAAIQFLRKSIKKHAYRYIIQNLYLHSTLKMKIKVRIC